MYIFCVFFFFKQKTAYEMRISDWSSDVCSSDLKLLPAPLNKTRGSPFQRFSFFSSTEAILPPRVESVSFRTSFSRVINCSSPSSALPKGPLSRAESMIFSAGRSEEHTSELQSLMRISYAVFCLKKKKKVNTYIHNSIND